MVESKINVDFLANTSDFSKGVTRVNEMVETLDSLMAKISRNASKPLFDSSSLRSINDMVSSLKQAEQLVNKIKSTETTSKRNRNANRSSGQDNPFRNALRDDANKQIAQLRAQLNKERTTIQSSSKLIPNYPQSRGKVRTNQDFDTYVTENKQNRAGVLRREQAREDNSSIRNIMTAMDRYTNNIRNNDGRITAVQKRAYNSTLDKAGSLLDIDENGNSGYIQKLQEEKAGINARSNTANARLTELQNSGLPNEAIAEESANLVNDIQEAAKALNSVENSLKKADDAMAKFRDLQSAGSEIREVTPSRRSAFAVYAGISSVRGMVSSGENTLRAEQADTRSLTAANGTYDSYRMRRESEIAGLKYGISGSEMLAAENQYVQGAGYQNSEDVKTAGMRTGILAKTTGATVADSTNLTGTYASTVNGASSSDLSQFQHTFEGALDKSGMTKYGASQVKALDKLLSTVASQNGGSLTKEQANNLANLQGVAASTGDKSLMGEAGANTISTINGSITSGDNNLVRTGLIMTDPSKYGNGIQGWANQRQAMSEGLANKDVQNIVLGNGGPLGNLDAKSRAALVGVNVGNISPDRMQKLQEAYQKNGNLSSKELQELGVSSESSNLDKQRSSMEGKNDRNDASQQAAEAQLGQWTNLIKASTGALVADVAGLTTFGTALRVATTALGSVAPVKAGRMVASTLTGGNRNTSKYAPNNGMVSGTPTAWNERLSNKINTGGGKVGNYLRNTQVGQGVSGAATSFLGSNVVTGTTAKATKLTSAVENSSKLNAIRSATTNTLGRGASALGKVAPYAYGAYEGYQAITDKENRGSHIGSGLGNLAGTAIGGFFGGPIGMALGGLAGGVIGNSIGSLFDNKAVDKDDQANTNKKSAIEKQREKNIKDDTTLADKQLRALNKNLNGSSGSTGSRSSTTGTSPYDKALSEQGKSKKESKSSSSTVVVSGTINHTGSVADTSQLQANTQSALNNLLSVPNANEQTRK